MVEEFYRIALERIAQHLREAGAEFSIDDGDVLWREHRLGLSIAFEGFSQQQAQVIAPLDIQLHLDGDDGDRFRVGALGVGADAEAATNAAVEEWYVLAARPLLEALGARNLGKRRPSTARRVGRWQMFAGQVGVRGTLPDDADALAVLYRNLLSCVETIVRRWGPPRSDQISTIYLMATCMSGSCDVQAARDGLLNAELSDAIAAIHWPASADAYLYKQLFVLRGA